MTSPSIAALPARRRLLLLVVLLVAPLVGQRAAGASDVSVAPLSGPPGTTVQVRFEGSFAFCAVFFDGKAMGIAAGCEGATVSFAVRASAPVGEHTILVLAGGGETRDIEQTVTSQVTPTEETTTTVTAVASTTTVTVQEPATTEVTPSVTQPPTISPPVTATAVAAPVLPAAVPLTVASPPAVTLPTTLAQPTTSTTIGLPAACPAGQVALASIAVEPTGGRPGTRVLVATRWGSTGTCTAVRPLEAQFDGRSAAGRPPPAGTSGTFEMVVPEDVEPGRHRISLVVGGEPALEVGSVAFEVEGDGGSAAAPLLGVLIAGAALLLTAVLAGARRRRSGGPADQDPHDRAAPVGAAGGAPERWRTALKAAYFVGGAQGAQAFAWAAGSRNPEQRATAAFALARLHRLDPAAVLEVLGSLAHRVGMFPRGRTARILRTLAGASCAIYVSHPEERATVSALSELGHTVLKKRLRLHPRRWLAPFSATRSRRLETALFGPDPDAFFHADADLRARFARVVSAADPTATFDLATISDDLAALLESPVHLHNVLAALTVATHAAGNFEDTEPLVRELYRRVDAPGRVSLLQAFAVLLPGTPSAWRQLLEEMTNDLVTLDRETFLSHDGRRLGDIDIALLALGLAYAKSPDARGMPVIDAGLAQAAAREDWPLVARVVEGLGPIGFYHPEMLFRSLRPLMAALLADPTAGGALVSTLADTRTVWFDEVDLFLRETGASPEFRRLVASATSPRRMAPLVAWIGLHNGAVHLAVENPTLHRHLVMGGLEDLATASSPRRFVRRYARRVLKLLDEADHDLIGWTTSAPGADGKERTAG